MLPAAVAGAVGRKRSVTLVRVEGPAGSVAYRSELLTKLSEHQTVYLEQDDSRDVWRAVRELEPLASSASECLWRISVTPTRAGALATELRRLGPARAMYDWGGALLWLALPRDASPRALHKIVRSTGAQARLLRYSAELPEEFPAFTPLAPGVEALNRNLKQAFDPQGVLNPGRMYHGW